MSWGQLKGLHLFSVRQRYVLTRRNKLRLRYLVVPALAVLLLAGGMEVAIDQGIVTDRMQLASADDANFVPATIQDAEDQAEAEDNSGDDNSDVADSTPAIAPIPTQAVPSPATPSPTVIAAIGSGAAIYGPVRPQTQAQQPVQQQTVALNVPQPPVKPIEKILRVGKGDTLNSVLVKAGFKPAYAVTAAQTLKPYYNSRSMSVGQKLTARFDPDGKGGFDFAQLAIETDPLSSVTLQRSATGALHAAMTHQQAVEKLYARHANIDVSLYGSALKAHIPSSIVAAAIRIYSWNVDFQREMQPGDVLDVMYQAYEAPNGKLIRTGDIVYAHLNIGGRDIPIYRFQTKDGGVDYYTADGHSIRKALLSTPVDGARVSSGFGLRLHPVLGFTKMHKGIDFAAPIGTPIFAAGNGTIEKIGPFSTYGNYIRIKHNATLETAYAHMLKFAQGLRDGARVHQGQVIGYIGQTGRSTGPHLHYEVLINNQQVNPSGVKVQSGDALSGAQMAAFKARVRDLSQRFAATLSNRLAMAASVNSATIR